MNIVSQLMEKHRIFEPFLMETDTNSLIRLLYLLN